MSSGPENEKNYDSNKPDGLFESLSRIFKGCFKSEEENNTQSYEDVDDDDIKIIWEEYRKSSMRTILMIMFGFFTAIFAGSGLKDKFSLIMVIISLFGLDFLFESKIREREKKTKKKIYRIKSEKI